MRSGDLVGLVIGLPRPPNVALLRALWSLLDGIWGVFKGSWGVLVVVLIMGASVGY